jgi:hypothetical protein
MLSASLMLMGCQTTGSATKLVTCETITFVWLSRKDVLTPGTTRQIVANNGAWQAVCGKPKKP